MADVHTRTFLIVTADDFGRSVSINRAIEAAATQGICTCASLMMTGLAVGDAVERSRSIPALEVGLHLTLTEDVPLSPSSFIPALVTRSGRFPTSPLRLGMALYFGSRAQEQTAREVAVQFEAFAATGLPLHHVDCHHHLQVHPSLFRIMLQNALMHDVQTMRIPYEPWSISGPICPHRRVRNWLYRNIFTMLTARCRTKLQLTDIRYADGVFGLYQTEEITEAWLIALAGRLAGRPGIFEVYTHPSDDAQGPRKEELKALLSLRVRAALEEKCITLIRYQDIASKELRARS